MTTHEINLLIERYLDGETTPAEERALALAVQREDRPAEWAIIAEMLGELTTDEAIWTLPLPLPKGRGVDTTSSERLMAGVVTSPRPLGRGRGRVCWAAACAIVAFGLSYYIIKEAPQETAKADQPQHVQPQQKSKPVGEPLLAACPKPPISKPLQHIEKTPIEEPLPEARVEEPLPEPQPQLIAEEETLPPQENFALCMALIAEVEARAVQVEQSEQQLYQALLDELLVNIQQQSNRPELSL